jgi:hypothetical protein
MPARGTLAAGDTATVSAKINAAAPRLTINRSSDDVGGGCSVAVRIGTGGSYIDGTRIPAGLGSTVWGIRIRRRRG